MIGRAALFLLCLASLSSAGLADDFPSRLVTIISPYQAGGTSDIIARLLARRLSERWGKNVIIDNRPGANGGIGVTAVTHSAPDGHTLLAVASSALTINPLFYPKLPYDVSRDLAPVTRTGSVANVLVVNPAVAVNSVQELIALARSKPGQLSYASQGTGSNGQVTGELFKQRANVDILHIPYKGSAPAIQDLLGGQVQLMFDNLPSVLPLIRAGKLRALAVTTATRDPQLPETPTIAEAGLQGFDMSAWFALLAPKATPASALSAVETSSVAVLNAPVMRSELAAAGVNPAAEGAAELRNRIDYETTIWRDVIAKAGIKVE